MVLFVWERQCGTVTCHVHYNTSCHTCLPACGVCTIIAVVKGPVATVSAATVQLYVVYGLNDVTVIDVVVDV